MSLPEKPPKWFVAIMLALLIGVPVTLVVFLLVWLGKLVF